MGAVKVDGPARDASVYLDGAYAGRLGELKRIWLEPGVYTIEVRETGRRLSKKIYILSGKTMKLTADRMEKEALP